MLVEKRISTKLNYDVLRDIEIDLGGHQNSLNHTPSSGMPTDNQTGPVGGLDRVASAPDNLAITRTPMQPRLPSLTSRKRDFSSLGGLSSFSGLLSPHPLTVSAKSGSSRNAKRSRAAVSPVLNDSTREVGQAVMSLVDDDDGNKSRDPDVVEESGPVEYCDDDEEGEGLDDDEMEELIYEDDPLLAHSDTEDYNEDY